MKIFVKSLTGRTTRLIADALEPFENVKTKLEVALEMPICRQQLVFPGEVGRHVVHSIKESTLHLVLRLRECYQSYSSPCAL